MIRSHRHKTASVNDSHGQLITESIEYFHRQGKWN